MCLQPPCSHSLKRVLQPGANQNAGDGPETWDPPVSQIPRHRFNFRTLLSNRLLSNLCLTGLAFSTCCPVRRFCPGTSRSRVKGLTTTAGLFRSFGASMGRECVVFRFLSLSPSFESSIPFGALVQIYSSAPQSNFWAFVALFVRIAAPGLLLF